MALVLLLLLLILILGGVGIAAAKLLLWIALILLFGYALYIRDPVFILGQGFGVFVYARNLYFELRDRHAAAEAA